MDLNPGAYKLTANSGKLYVYTFKEGVLSAVAHDLLIDATNFTINVNIPTAGSHPTADAEIKADSLKVVCAMKDGQRQPDTLKEKDKADIEEATFKDVLHPAKYPVIHFRSTSISREKEGSYRIKGDLTLHGVTRPVEFNATTATGKDLRGKVTIPQKDFGIKPYKALLGTLKVKNEVDIAFDLSLS